jgi:hypothetical protein
MDVKGKSLRAWELDAVGTGSCLVAGVCIATRDLVSFFR